MQGLKLLAATAIVFAGGWLLILTNGVLLALKGDHPDWYPVPSHPTARIAANLAVAISLQFVSAWLMMPASLEQSHGYWRYFAVRVALCICGCFAAVVVILIVSAFFCSDC
jgi:hypothetical protein